MFKFGIPPVIHDPLLRHCDKCTTVFYLLWEYFSLFNIILKLLLECYTSFSETIIFSQEYISHALLRLVQFKSNSILIFFYDLYKDCDNFFFQGCGRGSMTFVEHIHQSRNNVSTKANVYYSNLCFIK